jgi:hypothetical protein
MNNSQIQTLFRGTIDDLKEAAGIAGRNNGRAC